MDAKRVMGVLLAVLLAAPAGVARALPPKAEMVSGSGNCAEAGGPRFLFRAHDIGPDMMWGMGGPMMGGLGPIWKLDLNDDQLAKVRIIQQELATQSLELQGKVLEAKAQLPKLYAATPMDAKAIGKVYARIFGFYQQMLRNRIQAHNQVTALLNSEQRKRYERWRSGMMGPEMMGPHMMGPMAPGMGWGMMGD